MKKIFILMIIVCAGFISCTEPNVDSKKTEYILRCGQNRMEIVVIDSCEYLYGDWGNATVLTHKGNCKNHKH